MTIKNANGLVTGGTDGYGRGIAAVLLFGRYLPLQLVTDHSPLVM